MFGPKKNWTLEKLLTKKFGPTPIFLTLHVLQSFNCITEDCRLPRSAYFHFRFIRWLSLSFYTAWHTALYNMEKDILLLYYMFVY